MPTNCKRSCRPWPASAAPPGYLRPQPATPQQRAEFDKLDKPILAKLTEWAQKEMTLKSREAAGIGSAKNP